MKNRKFLLLLTFLSAVKAECEKPAVIVILMNGLTGDVVEQTNILLRMREKGIYGIIEPGYPVEDEVTKFALLLGDSTHEYIDSNEYYSYDTKKIIKPDDDEFFSYAKRDNIKTILNDQNVNSFCVDWIGSQYTPNGHRCKTAEKVRIENKITKCIDLHDSNYNREPTV